MKRCVQVCRNRANGENLDDSTIYSTNRIHANYAELYKKENLGCGFAGFYDRPVQLPPYAVLQNTPESQVYFHGFEDACQLTFYISRYSKGGSAFCYASRVRLVLTLQLGRSFRAHLQL